MSPDKLDKVHESSFNNGEKIRHLQPDTKLGCFYCTKQFTAGDVVEFTHNRCGTAICPECGIDAVIEVGPNGDVGVLTEMKARFFDNPDKGKEA